MPIKSVDIGAVGGEDLLGSAKQLRQAVKDATQELKKAQDSGAKNLDALQKKYDDLNRQQSEKYRLIEAKIKNVLSSDQYSKEQKDSVLKAARSENAGFNRDNQSRLASQVLGGGQVDGGVAPIHWDKPQNPNQFNTKNPSIDQVASVYSYAISSVSGGVGGYFKACMSNAMASFSTMWKAGNPDLQKSVANGGLGLKGYFENYELAKKGLKTGIQKTIEKVNDLKSFGSMGSIGYNISSTAKAAGNFILENPATLALGAGLAVLGTTLNHAQSTSEYSSAHLDRALSATNALIDVRLRAKNGEYINKNDMDVLKSIQGRNFKESEYSSAYLDFADAFTGNESKGYGPGGLPLGKWWNDSVILKNNKSQDDYDVKESLAKRRFGSLGNEEEFKAIGTERLRISRTTIEQILDEYGVTSLTGSYEQDLKAKILEVKNEKIDQVEQSQQFWENANKNNPLKRLNMYENINHLRAVEQQRWDEYLQWSAE